MKNRFTRLFVCLVALATLVTGCTATSLRTSNPRLAESLRLGAASYTNIVYTRPIDGVQDDWPALNQLLVASAYKNAVVMLPGPNGESWQCKTLEVMPNGTNLFGTLQTTIVSSLAAPGTGYAPFYSVPLLGATYTLSANVPAGATSIQTTTSIPAGSHILLLTGGGQVGNQYWTGTPTGSGPYTIPLDRPTFYAVPIASSTVELITTQPRDIRIQGNGMLSTGTGDGTFNFSSAYNVVVDDVRVDSSGGHYQNLADSIVALFDTGSYQSSYRHIYSTMPASDGGFLAAAEHCDITDSTFANATAAGLFLQSCADCEFLNDHGYSDGSYGALVGNAAPNLGSINSRIIGGSFAGNQYGIMVTAYSTGTDISGPTDWANSISGIYVDATTSTTSIRGSKDEWNGVDGITVASGVIGPTLISDSDVSDDVNTGIDAYTDVIAKNITCLGNTNAMTGHSCFYARAGVNSLDGFEFQSADLNWQPVLVGTGRAKIRNGVITADDGTGYPYGVKGAGADVVDVDHVTVNGAHAGTNVIGFGSTSASSLFREGTSNDLHLCAVRTSYAGPSSRGTIVANGTTAVSQAFSDLTASDIVGLTLTTVGGTPGHMPLVTQTPGTGFSITSVAGDTSTYTYVIQ